MQKDTFFLAILSCLPLLIWGQGQPKVEVCDLILQLKGKEVKEVYYGFAAGDQIIVDFNEVEGRPVAGLEILEYPENIRFREMETAEVRGKTLYVQVSGVYKFSIFNERGERNCKLRISRVPVSEKTRAFRTAVRWVDRYDTTYVDNRPAAVENRVVQRSRQVLDKVDTTIINLTDNKERVHSRGNFSEDAFTTLKVMLPRND